MPRKQDHPGAGQPACPGLHPIVVAVDECQRWCEHTGHGQQMEPLAEDLVRRGPADGVIAVFTIQRPDAKSLPTGTSGNAVLRLSERQRAPGR